jgi:hypothetical protein
MLKVGDIFTSVYGDNYKVIGYRPLANIGYVCSLLDESDNEILLPNNKDRLKQVIKYRTDKEVYAVRLRKK